MKINLQKCHLGFCLTNVGVKLGSDSKKLSIKPSHQKMFTMFDNFWDFAILSAHTCVTLHSLMHLLQLWHEMIVGVKEVIYLKLLWRPSEILQSYLCLDPVVAYPYYNHTYFIITDATLALQRNQVALVPFSHSLMRKENIMSCYLPHASCRSMNATTPHSYWRCKLCYGILIILTPTYEANISYLTLLAGHWRKWIRCIPKYSTGYKRLWEGTILRSCTRRDHKFPLNIFPEMS